MDALQKIENCFNKSFDEVINILHWQEKRSIKSLSDECKVSRDTFTRYAKKYNLNLRSNKDACKLTKNKGPNHWAFGLTKETHPSFKKHSERMLKNNPSDNNDTLIRMAIARAEYFKQFPLPQEADFIKILDSLNVAYIFQYPFNRYIVDFFIPSLNLMIEIDSIDKWGAKKRARAKKKEAFMKENGFKTLSIGRLKVKEKSYIIDVLRTHNIIK